MGSSGVARGMLWVLEHQPHLRETSYVYVLKLPPSWTCSPTSVTVSLLGSSTHLRKILATPLMVKHAYYLKYQAAGSEKTEKRKNRKEKKNREEKKIEKAQKCKNRR